MPTKIVVEETSGTSNLEARYADYVNGEFQLPMSENYQIGFRVAKLLGLREVHTISAWTEFDYDAIAAFATAHGQEGLLAASDDLAIGSIEGCLLRSGRILGQLRLCKHSSLSRRLGCRFWLPRHFAPGAKQSSLMEEPSGRSFLHRRFSGARRKRCPAARGKLDLHHIGGHSFGAYTAGLLGDARILLPGTAEPRSFADSRVSAIVLLSPQGEGIMGLSVHSWDDVDLI
jgi:Family of unknown function (DUF5694)